jgi:hypothetical protein
MSTYRITPQSRQWWKDYWRGVYAMPRAWVHKGMNLVYAFEAVATASNNESWHLSMDDQAFMLAGMAIEVHLKAILVNLPSVRAVVTVDAPSGTADKKLHKIFYQHNIRALADAANVTLTVAERRTADALTQHIYWRGRYVLPTEKSIDDLLPRILPNGLVGNPNHIAIDDVRALIKRVIDEVNERLFDGEMEENASSKSNNLIRYPAYLTQVS